MRYKANANYQWQYRFQNKIEAQATSVLWHLLHFEVDFQHISPNSKYNKFLHHTLSEFQHNKDLRCLENII